jgi:hypothetical protein
MITRTACRIICNAGTQSAQKTTLVGMGLRNGFSSEFQGLFFEGIGPDLR